MGDWARAGARKSEQETNRLSKLVRIELRLRIQLLGFGRVNGVKMGLFAGMRE